MTLADEIKKLKKRIDAARPLSKAELRELQTWYAVTYTYHSNAIEGNTLTLGETKLIVEDGLTVGGHPLREILEAKNHAAVVAEMIAIVQKKTIITETLIKKLHKILIKSIDDSVAGVYRKIQVGITGDDHLLPSAHAVPSLMKDFFAWLKKRHKDPIVYAAQAHYRFVKIHPFTDGNGRIARVLSNLILMRGGYPLVIIPVILRQRYIGALHSSKTERDFVSFFQEVTLENMKDYLRMIGKSY